MTDTVAALSSGLVPSGVAVIRVSGPKSRFALETLAGKVPSPRKASVRALRDPVSGRVLDQALVLFFAAPGSFTGEDVAELHCHGGKAVVEAVLGALWAIEGIAPAGPGDFTRQAFLNGKMDLTQVEAVGDLIHASSSEQHALALAQLSGAASRKLFGWKEALVDARAAIEADLDFSDEDDVPGSVIDSLPEQLQQLSADIERDLSSTTEERLREGFRVVIAGAPNSGKSTLMNALVEREAALVSPIPGTTRDQIDVPLTMSGLPILLTDTAGLRASAETDDVVERMGIARAERAMAEADVVVWLEGGDTNGATEVAPKRSLIRCRSKSDLEEERSEEGAALRISGKTGEGLDMLKAMIADQLIAQYGDGETLGARPEAVAVNARRRLALSFAAQEVKQAISILDMNGGHVEHAAENLRLAQRALGEIVGDVDAEGVLDVLFSRFCIGK